jgi:DNA (cytosine-5)-methyltransferase 1
MIKVGTTFSGIGAPEQALKNLNIPHIVKWACDIDKYAKQTYLANHTCERFYDDITKIDLNELEYVDLYVFGFPCQDLTSSGKQDLSKGRSMLVTYSLNIIDRLLPKYILFENVKMLLSKKFEGFYSLIKDSIEKNYNFQLLKLNSKDFGVAQHRPRVFGVGIRKDLPNKTIIPQQIDTKGLHFSSILESEPDKKYFLSEERVKRIIDVCHLKQKRFQLQNIIGEVKQANKCSFYPDKKIRYTGISFCQMCFDFHGIIYPDSTIRMFTPRECARMQGFPDDFIIYPKDTIAYKQFGNTITVNVLERIFTNLLLNKS